MYVFDLELEYVLTTSSFWFTFNPQRFDAFRNTSTEGY